MQIHINDSLFHMLPQFKIGMIHYTKTTVSESPQMIQGRTRLYQESLYFDLQDKALTEFRGIQEWRSVWKTFGADPSRYRHAAEALLRRIRKGDYLQPVNSAVDLNNFFSLQYEIPVGIYNAEALAGDITIALGSGQTQYEALNGRITTFNRILVASDAIGAFGSPYVDSKRSCVDEKTTELVQLFYLKPSLKEEEAYQLLRAASKMFTQVNGGESSVHLLTAQNNVASI